MAETMSDMSFWIKFFKEAGIPAGDAANYAVTFSDNRITRSMLMDLTKEYLSDMGIAILGDVISILKHAKSVYNQDVRDRVLRDTGSIVTPVREVPSPKRSTPASRTIAHHIGTDRCASPTVTMAPVSSKISKSLSARLGTPPSTRLGSSPSTRLGTSPSARLGTSPSARLGTSPTQQVVQQKPVTLITLDANRQKEVVPVPKKRRVFPEHEGKYKITMPAGTTAKTRQILEVQRKKEEAQRIKAEEKKRAETGTAPLKDSVFARLGGEKAKGGSAGSGPTVTITGLGGVNMPSATQSSVFHRLGGKSTVKRAATSTVTFDDDDIEDDDDYCVGGSLEYAGVLKHSPTPEKRAKIEAAKKIKKVARQTLAKAQNVELKSEGFFARQSSSNSIKARLGTKSQEVSSTTQSAPAKVIKGPREGIQGRLGSGQLDQLTITVDTLPSSSAGNGSSIFSRLGKTK